MPHRPQRAPAVKGIHSLSRVFDEQQTVLVSQFDQRVHFTSNSSIMDREDRLRPWRDRRFHLFFVHIECV